MTQSCLRIIVPGAGLGTQVSCLPGQYVTPWLEGHTDSFLHSNYRIITYAMCSVTASGTPFLQRGLASCFRPSLRDGRGGFALAWDLGAVFPYLLQLLSYCVTGLFSSSSNWNSSCCNTSSSACSYRCRECVHVPRGTMKHEQWHRRYHKTWVTEQLLVALGHVQTTDCVLKNSADKDVGAYRIRQQERW